MIAWTTQRTSGPTKPRVARRVAGAALIASVTLLVASCGTSGDGTPSASSATVVPPSTGTSDSTSGPATSATRSTSGPSTARSTASTASSASSSPSGTTPTLPPPGTPDLAAFCSDYYKSTQIPPNSPRQDKRIRDYLIKAATEAPATIRPQTRTVARYWIELVQDPARSDLPDTGSAAGAIGGFMFNHCK